MCHRSFLLVLAVLAAGLGAAEPDAATGSALTAAEAEALVRLHNDARGQVGVQQRLTWSKELARHAQEWADRVAESGKLEHRPGRRYGENLAAGQGAGYGVEEAAASWLKEKADYDAGRREAGSVGHYTQVVWSRSKAIGAGKAVIKAGELKGWTVVVCNYDPPGNVQGEQPYP